MRPIVTVILKQKLTLLIIFTLVSFYFASRSKQAGEEMSTAETFSKEREPWEQFGARELDPDCRCRIVTKVEKVALEHRSLCGQSATDRGPNQKVISYSFFGSIQSGYYEGIFHNFDGVRQYYPSYVMRL